MSSSENTKSKSISDIIKEWFLNAPSYGIRRIGRTKTLIAGLFCGYIFWVFTLFMGCFIYIIFINYIAHPTKIHLSVSHYRDPKDFPAITFCNINPLKDDGFLYDPRNPRLPGAKSSSSSLNESEYRKAVSEYFERILAAQVHGQQHPFVDWAFKLNDLLITCTFNKRLCHGNLTQIFHPNYGNCYTFDNEKHVQSEINDVRYDWSMDNDNRDDNYKLFLELFLHQKDYNELLEHRAAFRIFIHRKNELPMLSENSVFVGPNKYTKLIFSRRVMSFLQQCQNDLTDDMKQIFLTRQVRYTQALCYKLCKHRFIVKKCHCIELTLAVFYQFFNYNNQATTNISLCSFDNKCLTTLDYFNSSKLCPECLPECEIIQYSVQSSYALYPNSNASPKVLQRVRNHFRFDKTFNVDSNTSDASSTNHHTRLHDNIVAVEISASPYATEILTESSMYTWVDLISSIGGQAALWIGVSLISFVEIIELLYILIHRFCSYVFFCKKK